MGLSAASRVSLFRRVSGVKFSGALLLAETLAVPSPTSAARQLGLD